MITNPKSVIVVSVLCASVYVAWIHQHKPKNSSPLTNNQENLNKIGTYPVSWKSLESGKATPLLNKIHQQLIAQQNLIQRQQIAIDTLFAALKEQPVDKSMPLEGEDSEHSNVVSVDEQTAKQVEILDSAFANESIDEKWSNAAVDMVSEIMDLEIPENVTITQLDCQSTFCKIGLDHIDETELENVLDNFMFKLGWQTSSFIQTTEHEGGTKATVVYLSRDGYSLPET